jgi:hypothetical protein
LSLTYENNDEQEETNESMDKNPLGLHQTEIIASLALDLLDITQTIINPITNEPFRAKFGILTKYVHSFVYFLVQNIGFHSGSAVGGIVGQKNFQYCLFGDTINMVSFLLN